ncbi:MAG: GFA family protein [Rhodobacter sp.]|nr:GFA family protein [Rhodobacter sp.]
MNGADRTGGCLCGAVRFTARDLAEEFGICHCETCRRWTGSALLGVAFPEEKIAWTGVEHICRYQSSSWAERAWCARCGTGLFFRATGDTPYSGEIELPLGIFDDPNGFVATHEIYIDHKPDSYSYAGGGRKTLTRADCVAKFPRLDDA